MNDERRKFERLAIPKNSAAYVTTIDGRKLGALSVLGRGGFQVDTEKNYDMGEVHKFFIVDKTEGINRQVTAIARNRVPGAVGFEFQDLDADAAVEIGVIIGKYYSSGSD